MKLESGPEDDFMNLHSATKTDELNHSTSSNTVTAATTSNAIILINPVNSVLLPKQPLATVNTDGDGNDGGAHISTTTTTTVTDNGGTKFTVTRVLENPATNTEASSCLFLSTTTSSSSDTTNELNTIAQREPLLPIDPNDVPNAPPKPSHLELPNSLGPSSGLNAAAATSAHHQRVVSVDSGFESIDKMRIASDDTTTPTADAILLAEEATDILQALCNNNNDTDPPNNGNSGSCDTTTTTTSTTNNNKLKSPGHHNRLAAPKKNRTTTVNTVDEQVPLEPMVINKSDGLQDVLYYIDENGSPKIREKFSKKGRAKKASEQKKKLTYGTEADIADTFVFDEKTASCVSFTRLCKRFKKKFSKCHPPNQEFEYLIYRTSIR